MVNYDTQGFESYTNFAKLDGAMQGYTDDMLFFTIARSNGCIARMLRVDMLGDWLWLLSIRSNFNIWVDSGHF